MVIEKYIYFKYNNITNRARFSSFWKDVTLDLEVVEFYLNKSIGNGASFFFVR
jgi:hypothetical protein